MLLFIGLFHFPFFALLGQASGYIPSSKSDSLILRGGYRASVARETQSKRALPTSSSAFYLSESPDASLNNTISGNPTDTVDSACSLVTSILSLCNSISPGFSTYSYTDQTSCLCYTNSTVWIPDVFDNAIATCAQSVSATPSEYSQVTGWEGFCTGSGPLSTPLSTPVSSVFTTPPPSTLTETPTRTSTSITCGANGGCGPTVGNTADGIPSKLSSPPSTSPSSPPD